VVQVSTKNGLASQVTVALSVTPSSLKPEFSKNCAKGDGTASCSVSSVTAKQPASLDASIAVASDATSVSSVKLTATASVTTTVKWTPPAAAETIAVTSASASASATDSPVEDPVGVAGLSPLPLGSIANLNNVASQLIGAGNAAPLFPAITAARGSSASPSDQPQPSNLNTDPVSGASPVSADTPVSTVQVAGLIALGLAIMLIVTRLAVRKRSRPNGPRS
jgi:hypothetical protein